MLIHRVEEIMAEEFLRSASLVISIISTVLYSLIERECIFLSFFAGVVFFLFRTPIQLSVCSTPTSFNLVFAQRDVNDASTIRV